MHGVRIDYRAPPRCPPRHDFLDALAARIPPEQRSGLSAARGFSVTITETRDAFRGSLTLLTPQDAGQKRTLHDTSCRALVDALALVAAMELEVARAQPGGTARREEPETQPQRFGKSRKESLREREYEVQVFAVGGVQTAPAPEVLPSAGFGLGIGRRPYVQGASLSVHYGRTRLLGFQGGDVRFQWWAARLLACPLGIEWKPFAALACVTSEFGLLRGEPTDSSPCSSLVPSMPDAALSPTVVELRDVGLFVDEAASCLAAYSYSVYVVGAAELRALLATLAR